MVQNNIFSVRRFWSRRDFPFITIKKHCLFIFLVFNVVLTIDRITQNVHVWLSIKPSDTRIESHM